MEEAERQGNEFEKEDIQRVMQCNLRQGTALPEPSKRHQHICLAGTHVLYPSPLLLSRRS